MVERYVLPASFGQERMWFAQVAGGAAHYRLRVPVRLPLPVTVDLVRSALATVVDRHETLRTALELRDDELVQVVHSEVPIELGYTDLSELPPDEREASTTRIGLELQAEELPLEQAPMWRAHLVRRGATDWVLLLVLQHAIHDATSMLNLRDELTEVCRASLEGRAPTLPELAIQYADFAGWQREELSGGHLTDQLAFWQSRLAGLPAEHSLPIDRPRPAAPTFAAGTVRFAIPEEVAAAARQLAGRTGGTPFMVLLAAYQALVARLSGVTDVAIGNVVAGRGVAEVGPLIGLFINTVVLRGDLSGNPEFTTLVERTRQRVLEAWEYQDTPFEAVVGALAPARVVGRLPVTQLGMNFLPARGYAGDTAGSAGFVSGAEDVATTDFDLQFEIYEHDSGMTGCLEFSAELFDHATVESFAQRYLGLLTAAVRNPTCRLSQLPLLTEAERHAQPVAAPAPPTTLVAAAVLETSRLSPDATAATGPDGSVLSYAALVQRAERLAHGLVAADAPGQPVGVLVANDADASVAVLAILLAGAVCLPLDPALPAPRRAFLLADAKPAAVITDGSTSVATTAPVFRIDDPGPEPDGKLPDVDPAAAAWLCYPATRGGLPRGVVISHRALAAATTGAAVPTALADGFAEVAGLQPGDPGVITHLLDANLEPVPDGVRGEIYLAGPALADGYRGRPGPTADRFIPDPHSATPGGLMFRTGLYATRRAGVLTRETSR